jgi:hypothetical protein
MKPLMLSAAALLVAFGLSACESKRSTTVVQPKEVVKEKSTVVVPTPGSRRPSGAARENRGDTVIVTPAEEGLIDGKAAVLPGLTRLAAAAL